MRQFTADVSHELRTPLTAIRSVGEVGLREHRDDAEYRGDHRQHARGSRSARQPRRSAADAVARRDAGRRSCRATTSISRRSRKRSASHLGVLAEEKKQTHRRGALRDARTRAPIAWSLRQAVINLVDNAIKFSPRRRPHPHPRVRDAARARSLDVIDSGPGIDAEARARIFDRFYRAATRRRRARRRARPVDREGRGRGERRTADARERRCAGGCTFRITLPRRDRPTGARPPDFRFAKVIRSTPTSMTPNLLARAPTPNPGGPVAFAFRPEGQLGVGHAQVELGVQGVGG